MWQEYCRVGTSHLQVSRGCKSDRNPCCSCPASYYVWIYVHLFVRSHLVHSGHYVLNCTGCEFCVVLSLITILSSACLKWSPLLFCYGDRRGACSATYRRLFCSISWKTEKLILKVRHFGSLLLLNLMKDEGKIPSQQQEKGAVSHSTFYIHIMSTVSTCKLKITSVSKDACNWDTYLCLQWTTNSNANGRTSSSPLLIDQ